MGFLIDACVIEICQVVSIIAVLLLLLSTKFGHGIIDLFCIFKFENARR